MMALPREITQRELRNDSGGIMRALDRGNSFIVTRNGVPVGALNPMHDHLFSKTADVLEAFRNAPRVDAARFRADVDRYVDQNDEPRA
jgi:antitoxin (DNA-binding transcriptional repressor) of toxin-antitoxin stability system